MKVILSTVAIERFLNLKMKLRDEENLIAHLLGKRDAIVAIDSEHIELWNKLDELLK